MKKTYHFKLDANAPEIKITYKRVRCLATFGSECFISTPDRWYSNAKGVHLHNHAGNIHVILFYRKYHQGKMMHILSN